MLWQTYQVLMKSLEQKNGHAHNEKQLFHGTNSEAIERINKQGFNRSYAGINGNEPHHP